MRCFASSAAMTEFWGIVGLLHDIDFEPWPGALCQGPDCCARAVQTRVSFTRYAATVGICVDIKPEHELEKLLYAADELTG